MQQKKLPRVSAKKLGIKNCMDAIFNEHGRRKRSRKNCREFLPKKTNLITRHLRRFHDKGWRVSDLPSKALLHCGVLAQNKKYHTNDDLALQLRARVRVCNQCFLRIFLLVAVHMPEKVSRCFHQRNLLLYITSLHWCFMR